MQYPLLSQFVWQPSWIWSKKRVAKKSRQITSQALLNGLVPSGQQASAWDNEGIITDGLWCYLIGDFFGVFLMGYYSWNGDFKRHGHNRDVLWLRKSWKKYGALWADGVASSVVKVGARASAHIIWKSSDNFYYEICYYTYTVIDIPGFYIVLYLLFQGFCCCE